MAAAAVVGESPTSTADAPTLPDHLSVIELRRDGGELFSVKVYVPGAGARWVVMPNRLLTVDAVSIAAHVLQAIAKGF